MWQVFRREGVQQEVLVEMDFSWAGNQKFQLQVRTLCPFFFLVTPSHNTLLLPPFVQVCVLLRLMHAHIEREDVPDCLRASRPAAARGELRCTHIVGGLQRALWFLL